MKLTLLIFLLIGFFDFSVAQSTQWKIVEGKITTPWSEKVDPARTLPEYPRPQLVRTTWMNLNGLWDYWPGH